MKRCLSIFILLFLLSTRHGNAQIVDSVRIALQEEPQFVFGLNSRISTALGEPNRTTRLFAGVDYDEKIRFEVAYNYMPVVAVDKDYVGRDSIVETNQMKYLGLQAEYTYYRTKKWKLSVPVQLGLGGNRITRRTNGNLTYSGVGSVVPLEVGSNAIYYFYDWVGLKAGLGVRLTFGSSFSSLSGSYYNVGIALFPGKLHKRFKDKMG